MIRFGTKTLLFAFVLVALWCSTFGGYTAGRDVRASVLLIVLFAAGYAAVYGRGKQRAFWSGFFLVMLLTGGSFFQGPANKYVPNFFWRIWQPTATVTVTYAQPPVYSAPVPPTAIPADPVLSPYITATPAPAPYPPVYAPVVNVRDQEFALAVNATIETVWTLALASIVGLIGIWVYLTAGRDSRST